MPIAAEHAAEIARNGAHISALAAMRFEDRGIGLGLDKAERMNGDGTRREIGRLAVAGEIIGALAGDLDRRIDRRLLQDRAGELRKRRQDRLALGPQIRASR